jgi:hypothetical protein
LKSFTWSEIEHLDNRLFKRALKNLKSLHKEHGVDISIDEVDRQLSKAYVKDRSVQVVMEMCHEYPLIHKMLINFVTFSIFEKLQPNDFFSFLTLRSGKRAYQSIPLEMKKFNANIKRRYLK